MIPLNRRSTSYPNWLANAADPVRFTRYSQGVLHPLAEGCPGNLLRLQFVAGTRLGAELHPEFLDCHAVADPLPEVS